MPNSKGYTRIIDFLENCTLKSNTCSTSQNRKVNPLIFVLPSATRGLYLVSRFKKHLFFYRQVKCLQLLASVCKCCVLPNCTQLIASRPKVVFVWRYELRQPKVMPSNKRNGYTCTLCLARCDTKRGTSRPNCLQTGFW